MTDPVKYPARAEAAYRDWIGLHSVIHTKSRQHLFCAGFLAAERKAPASPAEALPSQTSGAGICGISADTENKRVLKLHFRHEVTDADRKAIVDAFNALNRERSALAKPASEPAEGGA
ncbi:hypothetical protein [Bosea sp. MMO-172]|uniref:hypothetical protein n=1 Tax=Bosea sp. MMO-172 TaxID=3127885 RepID=UPI003016AD59